MIKKIVFATKNEGKLKEIRAVLSDWEIVSLNDAEFCGGDYDITEDGETFEQNAVKKAEGISAIINELVPRTSTIPRLGSKVVKG